MTSARSRFVPALVITGCALLVCAPFLFSRGFVLLGDMTFVPVQPWKDAWLGLDGSVPRAVPADALVSVLTHLVPGDLLQKAILLGSLLLAGFGAMRLAGSFLSAGTATARIAALAAGVLYLWNPWVLERLAIGHWGLLLGYAALPWVALAAKAYGAGTATLPPLTVALAVAAIGSPTGGIAAGLVAVVLTSSRDRIANVARVLAVVIAVNLPWLLPGILGSSGSGDPGGVEAFAARSDSPLGVIGSLLTFGGIWKASIVPGERGSVLLVLLALALSLAGLALLALSARRSAADPQPVRRLLLLAALGFVLAVLPATGPGRNLVTWAVEHVPGSGVLRDSQKWLLLFVLATCVGVGLVVERVSTYLQARGGPARSVTAALAMLPLVLLPTLAWGISGKLEPVTYPVEWAQVRSVLADQSATDRRIAVLPWSAYQRLPWNGERAALDPAIRFFPGDVITNDDLSVSATTTVTGEDPVAAQIGAVLARGEALGPALIRLGIRYVLIEESAAGRAVELGTPTTVLHQGPELTLLDLGPANDSAAGAGRASYAGVLIAGDSVAAVTALISALLLTVRRIRRKTGNVG